MYQVSHDWPSVQLPSFTFKATIKEDDYENPVLLQSNAGPFGRDSAIPVRSVASVRSLFNDTFLSPILFDLFALFRASMVRHPFTQPRDRLDARGPSSNPA